MKRSKTKSSDSPKHENTDRKIQEISQQITKAKASVMEGIEKAHKSRDKIDLLVEKSNELNDHTIMFNRRAKKLRRKIVGMEWHPNLIALTLLDIGLFGAGVGLMVAGGGADLISGLYLVSVAVIAPTIAGMAWKYREPIQDVLSSFKERLNTYQQTNRVVFDPPVMMPEYIPKSTSVQNFEVEATSAEQKKINQHILPIELLDAVLIDSFLSMYERVKIIDINRWPLSIVENIDTSFDLSMLKDEPYELLYKKLSKQTDTWLSDHHRDQLKYFLQSGRALIQINQFLIHEYPNLLSQLKEFEPAVSEFLSVFCQVLGVHIGEENARALKKDIHLTNCFELMIKNALLSHIDRIRHVEQTGHQLLSFQHDFRSQWSMVVKHVFRETKNATEWLLKKRLKTHPIFGLEEDVKKEKVLKNLYALFSGHPLNLNAEVKKAKGAIQKASFQLQFFHSSIEAEAEVKILKDAMKAYEIALKKKLFQVNRFVDWFLTHRQALETLKDCFDNSDDQKFFAEDITFSQKIKLMLQKIMQEKLGIKQKRQSDQGQMNADINDIHSMDWVKKHLKTCVDQWNTLKNIPNLAKEKNKKQRLDLTDPLVCVSRYAHHTQKARQTLAIFEENVKSIKDNAFKKAWEQERHALGQQLTRICNQHSPETDSSINALKKYRKKIKQQQEKLLKSVQKQIKSICKPIFKIDQSKSEVLISETLQYNNIERLTSVVTGINILNQFTKEAIAKQLREVFAPIKALTEEQNVKKLKNALFLDDFGLSIQYLNMLIHNSIHVKACSWVNMNQEINFLTSMNQFSRISKKIETINPEITGEYKVILFEIEGKGLLQSINRAFALFRKNGQYSILQNIIHPQISILKYNIDDFYLLDDDLINEFLRFVSECKENQQEMAQIFQSEKIKLSIATHFFERRIFSAINGCLKTIYDGHFSGFVNQFKALKMDHDTASKEAKDYVTQIRILNQNVDHIDELLQLISDKIMQNEKVKWQRELDSIEKAQKKLMITPFEGQNTVLQVKKYIERVKTIHDAIVNGIQKEWLTLQGKTHRCNTILAKKQALKAILEDSLPLQPKAHTNVNEDFQRKMQRLSNFKTVLESDDLDTRKKIVAIKLLNQAQTSMDSIIQETEKLITAIEGLAWIKLLGNYGEVLHLSDCYRGELYERVQTLFSKSSVAAVEKTISAFINDVTIKAQANNKSEQKKVPIITPENFLTLKILLPAFKHMVNKLEFFQDWVLESAKICETLKMFDRDKIRIEINQHFSEIENCVNGLHDFEIGKFIEKIQKFLSITSKKYFTQAFEEYYSSYEKDWRDKQALKPILQTMVIKSREKFEICSLNASIHRCENDELREKIVLFFDEIAYQMDDIDIFSSGWLGRTLTHEHARKKFLPTIFNIFEEKHGIPFAHFVARFQGSTLFSHFWNETLKNGTADFFLNKKTTDDWNLVQLAAKYQSYQAFQLLWSNIKTEKNTLAKNIAWTLSNDNTRYGVMPSIDKENTDLKGFLTAHMVAQFQSAKNFNLFWQSLDQATKAYVLERWVTRWAGDYPDRGIIDLFSSLSPTYLPFESLVSVILEYQPADTFLNWWESLDLNTQKRMLFSRIFNGRHTSLSALPTAAVHLSGKKFLLWLNRLDRLHLNENEWKKLLFDVKDHLGINTLDMVACYKPDVLEKLMSRLCNPRILLQNYSSPLIESISFQQGENPKIDYTSKQDALGNAKASWLACQNNVERLKNTNLTGFFSNNPLKTAVISGNIDAVKCIIQKKPSLINSTFRVGLNQKETALTIAFNYINRHGLETMKPIIDHMLAVNAERHINHNKWFFPKHYDRLIRQGYYIHTQEKKYPTINLLKHEEIQIPMLALKRHIKKGILSENMHALMPKPKNTDTMKKGIVGRMCPTATPTPWLEYIAKSGGGVNAMAFEV